MRVITGSAKGRKLLAVPGDRTRPITDRTKSALFSILGQSVVDSRFLDLFGGTGGVGIEALSRGAAEVVFVEIDRLAVRTIGENLRRTGLADRAHVVRGDSFAFLSQSHAQPFDFIYVAPPQNLGLWLKTLQTIDLYPSLLAPEAEVIVQIHPKERQDLALHSLELLDERTYGSTRLLFWGPPAPVGEAEQGRVE
ncbi:MAG TPA: 16S rRNA (guanine(966)-N(2))-methyltransferase RsmD [Anaerolineae bacterium]|nr:16S rRNA (guanine(966)-N(2))-methyltransferase RsmD [Anaerolineae bacterium]